MKGHGIGHYSPEGFIQSSNIINVPFMCFRLPAGKKYVEGQASFLSFSTASEPLALRKTFFLGLPGALHAQGSWLTFSGAARNSVLLRWAQINMSVWCAHFCRVFSNSWNRFAFVGPKQSTRTRTRTRVIPYTFI